MANIFDKVKEKAAGQLQQKLEEAKAEKAKFDIDPRLRDLNEAQLQRAKQFRENMPKLAQQQGGIAEQGLRNQLASQMTDINRGANQRGLLYSGLAAGQQARAQAALPGQIGSAQAGINSRLEGEAAGYENQALQGALGLQNLGMQGQNQYLGQQAQLQQQALAERQRQAAGTAGLLGGIGSLAGMYAGSKFGAGQENPNAPKSKLNQMGGEPNTPSERYA